MTTFEVYSQISEVCPILEVTDDGAGEWKISYSPVATAAQISAAATKLATLAKPVPKSVKMWQAKAALSLSGKLEAANAVIAQQGGAVAIAWEYASDVSRDSPGMAAVGAAIGLNAAAIDALFISANSIKA